MKSWEQEEIKLLAHAIWEQQGRPQGREEEHWHEAERLFLARWLADKKGDEHRVRDLRARGAGA